MPGIKNWETSTMGILMIALAGLRVYSSGNIDLDTTGMIAGGVGLLRAKDGNKTHSPNPLPEPDKAK